MLDNLDAFLNKTERTDGGIAPSVNKSIKYPFLYITEITDVELKYLAGSTIKFSADGDEELLPLYLKTDNGGYRFLGYLEVCFSSVIQVQYLKQHRIYLKISKTVEKEVTGELFDSLLLTR